MVVNYCAPPAFPCIGNSNVTTKWINQIVSRLLKRSEEANSRKSLSVLGFVVSLELLTLERNTFRYSSTGKNQDFAERPLFLGIRACEFCISAFYGIILGILLGIGIFFTRHKTRQSAF